MDAIFDRGLPPPCPAPFNLAAHVLGRAKELAAKTALLVVRPDTARAFSFAELEATVLGTASGFLSAGLEPGDRLLMRLANSVEFPIAYLAAIAADIIPVPISALLTEHEVARIVEDISPRMIVAQEGLRLPSDLPCPVLDAGAMQAMYGLAPARYAMGDPGRPGYIVYTSGTSGVPRAVVHAHRAVWARTMMWDGWYGLEESDRVLHAGAFNWTYTLGTGLLDPWARGATALIPGEDVEIGQLGSLLKQHEATIFAAAPAIYRRLLRTELPTLERLRHGLSAGEKLPDSTRSDWEKATGTPLHEAFGMSECSTFLSASPGNPAPRGTLGYPQNGRRVAVLGESGPVQRGEPGVLAISRRDPGLMLGYWRAEEEPAQRCRGEWFLTGDVMSMGEDGAMIYLGRADDMMNAGGVRVSPIEVENALNEHPAIVESAAAEVRVKADTSVIAAFYVSNGMVDSAELEGFVAERLARYKCPRIFTRVDAIPKGANNKLLRQKLRQSFEHALTARPGGDPGAEATGES